MAYHLQARQAQVWSIKPYFQQNQLHHGWYRILGSSGIYRPSKGRYNQHSLLDVRTSKEYAEGHLAGAHQLDYLDPEAFDAGISKFDKSRTYYIYCRSGKRSHGACLKMKKQGFKVYDMEGGILNWTKLGMPVER